MRKMTFNLLHKVRLTGRACSIFSLSIILSHKAGCDACSCGNIPHVFLPHLWRLSACKTLRIASLEGNGTAVEEGNFGASKIGFRCETPVWGIDNVISDAISCRSNGFAAFCSINKKGLYTMLKTLSGY